MSYSHGKYHISIKTLKICHAPQKKKKQHSISVTVEQSSYAL